MDRGSGAYGMISKGLTFISLKSLKKKDWCRKYIWRNNSWKLPKFGDRNKFIDSRSSVNPTKQDKLKRKPYPYMS